MFLCFVPLIKAEISNIYYPVNSTINLNIPCFNNNTLCSTSAKCNITLAYSNDSLFIVNKEMINTNGMFSYKIYPNQTFQKGTYKEYVICSDGVSNGYSAFQFMITGSGEAPANDIMQMFIYIIFIASIILLFYTFFITIAKIVTLSSTIFDVLLAWASVILLIITIKLSTDYMITTFIEHLANTFLNVTIWTNGVLPMLAFALSFLLGMLQKKRPLSPKEIGGRMV